MTNRFLTGVKDIDILILSNLNDRELLQTCAVNQYANKLCYDETLWMNRFVKKFKTGRMHYKKKGDTWRQFYLDIIYYSEHKDKLDKENFKENLKEFFSSLEKNNINYIKSILPKGFRVNHERWNNIPFNEDIKNFKLFWVSPENQSFYSGNFLTYKYELSKEMYGIDLVYSPVDLIIEINNKEGIEDYNITESEDVFKNLWYGILERDILGFPVDYINNHNIELIFSTKNLKYLKPI